MRDDGIHHSEADRRLAARLRALRTERRWTLEALATRSGVSRATLSRIETNDVSPTAAVLGRLCAAFELTLSRLMAGVDTDPPALVRRADQTLWVDPATGFRRRTVSPPARDFECEVLECDMPAGAAIAYPLPPRHGLEHHLYLQSGSLDLTLDDRVHHLTEGDCLRYRLQGSSTFQVAGDRPARYVLVIR